MKKSLVLITLFLIFTFFFSTQSFASPIQVAVSIVPQASFVKAVGGDLVKVVTMIPPGNSPANYALSPGELTKFSDSQIYFSMGVPADLTNILPRAKEFNPNIKVIKLFEEVNAIYPDREFAPGKRDPHIWLSPKRVIAMIDIIANNLAKLDPTNKDQYQQNALEYQKKLAEADQKIKASLNNLKSKTFIVYHPAFGYFADEYGLEMLAIEQGGKEATPQRMQQIIKIAQQKNIKVIFYQAEIDSKQSQSVAEELDGKTVQIDPLAEDYIANLKKMAATFKSLLN
jgi:zinc transport system substrate-binding protein